MDVVRIQNTRFFVQDLPNDDVTKIVFFADVSPLIEFVRQTRKDVFLVGFFWSFGVDQDEQYLLGLNLCKKASCNLVFVSDERSGFNMIVTPEEARYPKPEGGTYSYYAALEELVEIAKLRSHLTFTRSTVIDGQPIPWDSELIPSSLRTVVNYCISRGAYKPFNGVTAGHFACKLNDTTFLTSIRKTNFNELPKIGLVKVVTDGPDTVLAYGARCSVGGQSQRIIFGDHQDVDCVVHAHVPIKSDSLVPTVSQRAYECGSHECGKNSSNGLRQFGNLKAVYLDEHGPNIAFPQGIDPQEVIDFIETNFDLDQKTGGFVSIQSGLKLQSTLDVAKNSLY
jgi:hypothetical protein